MVFYPITASIYNWLIQHATRRKLCPWKQRQILAATGNTEQCRGPCSGREAQGAGKDGNNRSSADELISHGEQTVIFQFQE